MLVAYRGAAAEALSAATVIEKTIEETITFTFPYVMMNSVMRVVKELNPRIVEQKYDETCVITLAIKRSMSSFLEERLNKLAFE